IISSFFIDIYMAGRMSVHKVIQKIHLIASMIMFSFLLVYLISGIILINHDLFSIPEVEVKQSKILVEKSMDGDPKDYAKYLKKTLDLRGRTEYRQDNKDNWIFHFNMPGEGYQVKLTPAQDTLYIRQSSQHMTVFTVAQRIHMLRGFKGGWEYTAWAVMYDVSCFTMILFAITGIIMWFRRRKKFRHGWWYLLGGILIPVLFIYAFVLWK
ncbi:MAG: PepSY-associated TM helix domain-containing protein, partial [Bacteroidales bacterium]|nr:PepSY-associated TM helix domain-containing protein [Bacteroidales bacterium]